MTYKIVKQIIWPWLLTLIWHWPWDWPLTLTIWRKQIVSKFVIYLKLRDVTSYVKSETTYRMRPSTRNIFQSTRSLYDFRCKSYGSNDNFHGYWCVWPWPWHLKVIWILSIHLEYPCMTGVNFEAICSLIAEIQHIEICQNSLYFIMGIFVAMETYVTLFRSMQFFARYIG